MLKQANERTIREAAVDLGVKVRTIRAWISEGKIKAYKRGSLWLIPADEVRRMSDVVCKKYCLKVTVDGKGSYNIKSNQSVNIKIFEKHGLKLSKVPDAEVLCDADTGHIVVRASDGGEAIFSSRN